MSPHCQMGTGPLPLLVTGEHVRALQCGPDQVTIASLGFLKWKMGMASLQDFAGESNGTIEVNALCPVKCAEQVAIQNVPLEKVREIQAA